MDRRRWSNVTAARAHYEARDVISGDAPIEAFLEVAARCNLRCQMCAINYDANYQPSSARPPFFEPDTFARLRPIFPSLVRAYLFGLGEPTLNKHLPDYVAELSAGGTEVWFNTNATLIDDEKAEALAKAGADCITVSIDGATAATYETIRRGAKFSAVVRGIRALVAAQRKYGRPKVNLSFVAMASNIAELPLLVELSAELGTYGVHIEPLYLQDQEEKLIDNYDRENLGNAGALRVAGILEDALARAERLGVDVSSRFLGETSEFDYVARAGRERPDWTCSEPWSSIWVTSGGEVRTCCINGVAFGNLYHNTIEEIWNGPAWRAFRGQHARREEATGCGVCMLNGRVRNSAYFRTVERVTYRPMFDPMPRAVDDAIVFDSPVTGLTVTDPLVITGRRAGSVDLHDVELMVDYTPVANLYDRAYTRNGSFAIEAEVPFVTEGAHVIWARRRGAEKGWGYREVFLWRPEGEGVRVTDELLLPGMPRALTVGGRRWPHVVWSTMMSSRGRVVVGRADLRALPPGTYDAGHLGAFVLQKL